MNPNWLDDLIALSESHSLSAAAERRHCSQSAFSRRIQAIEAWLGAPVIERDLRPAQLTPPLVEQVPKLRALTRQLNDLKAALRDDAAGGAQLSVATQHSISVGWLPGLFAWIRKQDEAPTSFSVRSANRDDCYAMLMTRQVGVFIGYEVAGLELKADETMTDRFRWGTEDFLPVAAPHVVKEISKKKQKSIPIIAYPLEVFFGELVHQRILSTISAEFDLSVVCKTALAPAALEMALAGLGIAWVPRSLIVPVQKDRLVEATAIFPQVTMDIVALQLKTGNSAANDWFWKRITSFDWPDAGWDTTADGWRH